MTGRSNRDFLFDLAGVLVEWRVEPLYMALFGGDRERYRHFFAEVFTAEKQAEICKGRPIVEVLDELVSRWPEYAEPIRAWDERWDDMVVGAIDTTVSLSRALRARGCGTFLLGNWSREEFDRAVRRFDFLDEFGGAVIAGDHGIMKPDPGLFRIALERFGLDPTTTVFIDDSEANVATAIELGLEGIVFESPEQLRHVFEGNGWLQPGNS